MTKPLIKELRKLRLAQGLDQREIANRIGVTRESVLNYEKGKRRPAAKILYRWCVALGYEITVRELAEQAN